MPEPADRRTPEFDRALIDALPDAVVVTAIDGTVRFASPRTTELTGIDPADAIGRNIIEFIEPDELVQAAAALEHAEHDPGVMGPMTFTFRRADGRRRVALVHSRGRFDDPDIGGLVITISDHTGAAMLEQALRGLAAGSRIRTTLALLVQSLAEPPVSGRAWLVRPRPDGLHVVAWSHDLPEAAPLVGVVPAPWWPALELGEEVHLTDLDDTGYISPEVRAAVEPLGLRSVSATPVRMPGRRDVDLCLVVWRDRTGPLTINQLRHLHQAADLCALALERDDFVVQLRHRASTDALTGIANRAQFLEAIEAAANSPVDDSSARTVVLYVDLDGFKLINDRFGHAVGDLVLSEVARRLAEATRPSDLVARFGGDEFAILCRGIHGDRLPSMVAQRLIDRITAPIHAEGRELQVGASVGIAFSEPGSPPGMDLLEAADRALYAAKSRGKGGFTVAGSG